MVRRRRSRLAVAILVCTTVPTAAFAANSIPGEVVLVSTSSEGVKANSAARDVSMSADGTRVAFSSWATNLHPAAADETEHIYVKDLETGVVSLASVTKDGVLADNDSWQPTLSGDGRRVAFTSSAANLDPRDGHWGDLDVYVKDLQTGDLTLVSIRPDGSRLDLFHETPVISNDGSKVAFVGKTGEISGIDAVWVTDLSSGEVVLASSSASGVPADFFSSLSLSGGQVFSGDSTLIVFSSLANNLHPDDDDDRGSDVYVKDLVTGAIQLIPSPPSQTHSSTAFDAVISADGSRVAYVATAHEILVRDLATGEVASVSTASVEGAPTMSADGRFVSFASTSNTLHPLDTDSLRDVYVRDTATGALVLVSGATATTVSKGSSTNAVLSAAGDKILFSSQSIGLVTQDQDSQSDAFVMDLRPVVAIDISPETPHNPIKTGSGTVTVAILGSVTFDVAAVDIASLCFGSADRSRSRNCDGDPRTRTHDVNADGRPDLSVRFGVAGSGIRQGDTQACLHGATTAGDPFEACDMIRAGRG